MENLEARILRLEATVQHLTTKNRRSNLILIALVAAIALPFLFGGVVQKKPAILQASSLEIIRDGKVFASLGSDPAGGLLNIKNNEQTTVVRLRASASGGGSISMNNKLGVGALRLASSALDSGLLEILRGTTPIVRIGLDTAGYGFLMLNNDKGTPVSTMRMDANGGTLDLLNQNGIGGIEMAVDGSSAGLVNVRNSVNRSMVEIKGNARGGGAISVRHPSGGQLAWIGKGITSLFSVLDENGTTLLKAP
ncbi:MAG: hypothetical protein WAO58_03330 [Fimbriimonadaceae bacterium]